MDKKEHNVITFLRNHGKEILERDRYKYEPIRKESKNIENSIDTEKIEYLQLKLEKQEQELEKLKGENENLKLNTNEEWFNKYKKYKDKYKFVKKLKKN